jgi:hypothetical protein
MKIASITCVKNESDILETFVRVNSSFINTFVFVDDTDDGSEILYSALANEGFKIIVLHRQTKKPPYRQDLMILAAINHLLGSGEHYDYFMPLDVDEFPTFEDLDVAARSLTQIPPDFIGTYYWETYVPLSDDFYRHQNNGLVNSFGKRDPEGTQYQKIIIPYALARFTQVSVGAHWAAGLDGSPAKYYKIDRNLGHFPVRTSEQIIRKNISAVYGLLRKDNRFELEGHHVMTVLKQIRQNNYSLPLGELQKIAFSYANSDIIPKEPGRSPTWIKPYELRYSNLVSSNFEKNLIDMLLDSWLDPFDPLKIKDFVEVIKN